MSVLVKTEDLSKSFFQGAAKVDACISVNIEILRGENIAIIGPSGAGKSTLMHMMGGLETPTSGRVYFDGTDIGSLGDSQRSFLRNRKIGLIFQFYNLIGDLNVLENVMLPAMMAKGNALTKSELGKKAAGLLDEMGLSKRLRHRPCELSGGESQRVAIARALVNDPEVIFCDEPTGNLDSAMGRQIYGVLFGLNEKRKMAVVIVTHQDYNVYNFDKIYKMVDGRLSRLVAE